MRFGWICLNLHWHKPYALIFLEKGGAPQEQCLVIFWECFPLKTSQRSKEVSERPPMLCGNQEGEAEGFFTSLWNKHRAKYSERCRIYCPKFKGRGKCLFWALEKAGKGFVCPWGGQVQLCLMRKWKGRYLQRSTQGWLGGAELLGQYLIQK